MFENVGIQHTHTPTHIRTTEACLYYKLTNEPKGSGELKIENKILASANYRCAVLTQARAQSSARILVRASVVNYNYNAASSLRQIYSE